MMIIGVDYHPSFQTIAFFVEETGECGEQELNLLEKTIGRHLPSLHFWTEQERAGCAYFAVVLLDRRIAFSREIAQQGES